jgi:RNA polymerase sigma-70 factor (ECF subfamily)
MLGPMERDLQALTDAAAAGDRGALETLLQRFLPDVRAFVRLRAGPQLRARESNSDLVQSVCREILEHAERFQHPSEGAFKHWLFTTAQRKIQHRHEYWTAQKRGAAGEVSLDAETDSSGSEALPDLMSRYRRFSSPSGVASLREEAGRIESAFDRLSEEHREVISLAYLAGLSRAEIAERMQRSEGAVRVLLHRALARMSGLLQPGTDGAISN